MNSEIFLAILAMNSYNRGYDQRVEGLKDTGSIGNANIGDLSDFRPASDGLRADFFAIEYEHAGETIIAYRGTDNLAKDAVNGYGVGAGFTGGIFARQEGFDEHYATN